MLTLAEPQWIVFFHDVLLVAWMPIWLAGGDGNCCTLLPLRFAFG